MQKKIKTKNKIGLNNSDFDLINENYTFLNDILNIQLIIERFILKIKEDILLIVMNFGKILYFPIQLIK